MPTQLVAITGDPINLSDRITVASEANVMMQDALSDGAGYDVTIAYDTKLERFVATSVQVTRARPGSEITSRLIRELKVQEIITDVALRDLTTFYTVDEEGPTGSMSGAEALALIQPAAGREPWVVREEAHLVHLLAKLGSWPPLVTVAERLQVSHSTAKRLVAAKRWDPLESLDG